jgi:hypothetical protein
LQCHELSWVDPRLFGWRCRECKSDQRPLIAAALAGVSDETFEQERLNNLICDWPTNALSPDEQRSLLSRLLAARSRVEMRSRRNGTPVTPAVYVSLLLFADDSWWLSDKEATDVAFETIARYLSGHRQPSYDAEMMAIRQYYERLKDGATPLELEQLGRLHLPPCFFGRQFFEKHMLRSTAASRSRPAFWRVWEW